MEEEVENDVQDEVEAFGFLSQTQNRRKNKNKGKKDHRKNSRKVISRMVERSKSCD